MNNLEEVKGKEFREYLIENLKLTPYQIEILEKENILEYSEYYIYKQKESVESLWWRLSLPFFCVVYIILLFLLPLNFIVEGTWGYRRKYIFWFLEWMDKMSMK